MAKHRRIILVVGKTGCGKSHLVKSLLPLAKRLVILDIQGEYPDPQYPLHDVTIFDDFDDFKTFMLKNLDMQRFTAVCRFDYIEDYEAAIEVAYHAENLTVVVEEAHNFGNAHKMTPVFERIVRLGRHHSITVIAISQRLMDLNTLVRSNADAIVCFALSMPADVKYLEQVPWIGEQAQEVARLEKYDKRVFFAYAV